MNVSINNQSKNQAKRIGLNRNQMAYLAAKNIPDKSYVNLGVGAPELIANHVDEAKTVIYHTENGVLGFGPAPENAEHIDYDLINAGKKPISLLPGASFFHHADSFAMIRGGHIDMCFLGAMQVAQNGDIANWSTGDKGAAPAVGGAMDLVSGVKIIHVLTDHTTKNGQPKLVQQCTFPLTGKHAINLVYTNLGIFKPVGHGFLLLEIAPEIEIETIRKLTDAEVIISKELKTINCKSMEK